MVTMLLTMLYDSALARDIEKLRCHVMRATPHFEDLRETQGLEPHGSGGWGDVTADSFVLLLAHYCLGWHLDWVRYAIGLMLWGTLERTWGCTSPDWA
jgi:hypothetical protein